MSDNHPDRGGGRPGIAVRIRRVLGAISMVAVLLTAPATAAADPVVAAAGDIACKTGPVLVGTSCHYGATSDLIANDPSVTDVLVLGDIQYECSDAASLLSRYDPTWGRFKSKTHPVLGNHEYRTYPSYATCDPTTTVATQGYFDYFNGAGVQNGVAGERGKGYYSFDIGTWHLVALNSNCSDVSCAAGKAQETWLRADLAAHPADCTLAFFHHPRFSSGNAAVSSTQPLWKALYDAHVDVALAGHEHFYERFGRLGGAGTAADKYTPVPDPNGIRQFTAGTGGRSHHPFNTIRPGSEVRNNTTYGVLELTLHDGSYGWNFVPELGGTFTDSGSDTCVTGDKTPPPAPTNLTATSTGAVDLSWTAPSDPSGIKGYEVYRGPAGGTRTKIASVGAVTSYRDTSVTPATAYDYAVRAVDGAGNVSIDSAVATVTTPAGTTTSFVSVADARTEQANPTTNYGTATTIGSDSGTTPKQSFLRFNVTGISGRTVQKAVLRLYVTNGAPDAPAVYSVADPTWNETAVTWSTQPALGQLLSDNGSVTASAYTDYVVTPAIVGGADGLYSFGIGTTPTTDGVDFRSKEVSISSQRPQLILTIG